jgi:urease accessory protein UreE
MFKSLPVVQRVYRVESLPEVARQYRLETITLGWEERLHARGRRRSDASTEFGMALVRGTVLHGGDCLVLDRLELVVKVVEREETVFVIEPATPQEWGLFAYNIGNSHQPIMITERGIVCPEAPGMELLLERHGIPYRRARRTFTPVGLGDEVYVLSHMHLLR